MHAHALVYLCMNNTHTHTHTHTLYVYRHTHSSTHTRTHTHTHRALSGLGLHRALLSIRMFFGSLSKCRRQILFGFLHLRERVLHLDVCRGLLLLRLLKERLQL